MQPHVCELNHKESAIQVFPRNEDDDLVKNTSDLANTTHVQAHHQLNRTDMR